MPPVTGVRQLAYGVLGGDRGRPGGWQVIDLTPGVPEHEARLMLEDVCTQLVPVTPMEEFPTPQQVADRQRRLTFRRVGGAGLLGHAVPAGPDATGRPGNVFSHLQLDSRWGVAGGTERPIDWWLAPWEPPYGAAGVAGYRLPEDAPVGDAYEVRSHVLRTMFDVAAAGRADLIAVWLDAIAWALARRRTLGAPRCVVLLTDNPAAAPWWVGIASHLTTPNLSRELSFSTYDRGKDVAGELPGPAGTPPPLVRVVPVEDARLLREPPDDVCVVDMADPPRRVGSRDNGAWSGRGLPGVSVTRWGHSACELLDRGPDGAAQVLRDLDRKALVDREPHPDRPLEWALRDALSPNPVTPSRPARRTQPRTPAPTVRRDEPAYEQTGERVSREPATRPPAAALESLPAREPELAEACADGDLSVLTETAGADDLAVVDAPFQTGEPSPRQEVVRGASSGAIRSIVPDSSRLPPNALTDHPRAEREPAVEPPRRDDAAAPGPAGVPGHEPFAPPVEPELSAGVFSFAARLRALASEAGLSAVDRPDPLPPGLTEIEAEFLAKVLLDAAADVVTRVGRAPAARNAATADLLAAAQRISHHEAGLQRLPVPLSEESADLLATRVRLLCRHALQHLSHVPTGEVDDERLRVEMGSLRTPVVIHSLAPALEDFLARRPSVPDPADLGTRPHPLLYHRIARAENWDHHLAGHRLLVAETRLAVLRASAATTARPEDRQLRLLAARAQLDAFGPDATIDWLRRLADEIWGSADSADARSDHVLGEFADVALEPPDRVRTRAWPVLLLAWWPRMLWIDDDEARRRCADRLAGQVERMTTNEPGHRDRWPVVARYLRLLSRGVDGDDADALLLAVRLAAELSSDAGPREADPWVARALAPWATLAAIRAATDPPFAGRLWDRANHAAIFRVIRLAAPGVTARQGWPEALRRLVEGSPASTAEPRGVTMWRLCLMYARNGEAGLASIQKAVFLSVTDSRDARLGDTLAAVAVRSFLDLSSGSDYQRRLIDAATREERLSSSEKRVAEEFLRPTPRIPDGPTWSGDHR